MVAEIIFYKKKQKIPENILILNKKHKKDGNSLQKNSTKKYNIKKSFFKWILKGLSFLFSVTLHVESDISNQQQHRLITIQIEH